MAEVEAAEFEWRAEENYAVIEDFCPTESLLETAMIADRPVRVAEGRESKRRNLENLKDRNFLQTETEAETEFDCKASYIADFDSNFHTDSDTETEIENY